MSDRDRKPMHFVPLVPTIDAVLAARATVFAALLSNPRKEGERSMDSLVRDACAIVAALAAVARS